MAQPVWRSNSELRHARTSRPHCPYVVSARQADRPVGALALRPAPVMIVSMTEAEIAKLATWLAKAGSKGGAETALLEGFCSRAVAAGLPLARAIVFIDTLHPIHEGRAFRWEREKPEATLTEYGRTTEGEAAERWRTSPFTGCWSSGESLLRLRLTAETEAEFPTFTEFREAKLTDFVAIINRFAADGVIGEMDCIYSCWMTDRAEGFADEEIGGAQAADAVPRACDQSRLARPHRRDPGRDLSRARRRPAGAAGPHRARRRRPDQDGAHGSATCATTRASPTRADPEQIIPLLNDYADAIVSAIHEHSGDVLKLIGDGVLAIFPARGPSARLRRRARRRAGGAGGGGGAERAPARRRACRRPTCISGSISARCSTAISAARSGSISPWSGPAVNEVSRIAAMCRSVDQPILLSSAFAESCADEQRVVRLGRTLRAAGRGQAAGTVHARSFRLSAAQARSG